MENTIYALKGSSEWCDILSSLSQGEGRFGWSYIQSANLNKLKQKVDQNGWNSLSDGEKDCYQIFLLDFKSGDYVIYINVPEWGKCTLAKVTGQYFWEFKDEDFNHRFPVDPSTIKIFDRNSEAVHPALNSRLKLQGRWWRIYLKNEFDDLLNFLEKGVDSDPKTPESNLRFLSNEIQPFLSQITQRIHHTHPRTDLEHLFSEVFKRVPGVIDVICQGGRGDHGADILVTFENGFPIPGLEQPSLMVVQVKSYEGTHWSTDAVEDIKRAFDHYPEASMGLIVSTATSITTTVESELDKLREESGKPVSVLVGPDIAAFLLRYGAKLLA